jgi:hypothetical protein
MPKCQSDRAQADEERLRRATRAGYRAVREGFQKVRASLMQQLAQVPRDGTADDLRAAIIDRLALINAVQRRWPGPDDEDEDER